MFHREGPSFLELMKEALVSTERGYDLIAPKFDRTPFRTPDAVLKVMAEVIGDVGSALDVCCGTGAAMLHLRPLVRERLVGLDFSRGMLEEAERRLTSTTGPGRVELVRGDALALPFDGEMDVITCVGAFGHILREDEERFVRGIARALKPRGRFVFATTHAPRPNESWFWMAHGFNLAMRIRNAIYKPEFIMYYLTFLWPEVEPLLKRCGFARVDLIEHRCPPPFERVLLVTAER